jgi:uncharacterized protein
MGTPISHPVRSPDWAITYQGVDITTELSAMVLMITYADFLTEVSGEVEVVIEDHDLRWQASWYPMLGDQIGLAIGRRGVELAACGQFQIDQLELTGPPDAFTMRGLAAFITPAMRTRNSLGYEGQTLLGIAQTIGGKYGLTVVSAPEVIDVAFERITQKHETDLAFLNRIALEHGYDFTIRGSILVFYSRAALEAVAPVRTLRRTDLVRFQFRNRTQATYRSGQVAYYNLLDKSLILQTAAATAPIPTNDVLKVVSRSESGTQALLKAQAALHLRNRYFNDASLTMPGSIEMASGTTVALQGFGEFDGIYIILIARHRIDRAQGYITGLEVSRVF